MNEHLPFIIAFEEGEDMSDEEMIKGFQAMIDDGIVWKLQGMYGRIAEQLIKQGYCHKPMGENHA